jgi:hypothetical protein
VSSWQAEEFTLFAEVVHRVGGRDEFAALTGAWLARTRKQLFPDLDRALSEDPVLYRRGLTDPAQPLGAPYAVWAGMRIQRSPRSGGGGLTLYSVSAWQRMLDGLAESYPFQVTVTICPLNGEGRQSRMGRAVTIVAAREHEHPEWARFQVSVPADLEAWPGSAAIQQGWASFVKEWAERAETCFGQVTDDANSMATALERATGRYSWDTVPRCEQALRGYSWVTVCPRPLAAQLGGAAGLAATGAFSDVSQVAGGSVFLRATPTLTEYGEIAGRRVLEALAPVLLPGRVAKPVDRPSWGRLVVDVDAADYRRGGG